MQIEVPEGNYYVKKRGPHGYAAQIAQGPLDIGVGGV